MCSIVSALLKDCFTSCVGSSSYAGHAHVAISKELSQNCSSYVQQSRELRSAFAELEVSDLPIDGRHTHGKSAAARSQGSAFIDVLGPSLGLRPVFLQGSSADERKGRAYTRAFYWGKDLNVTPNQVAKCDGDLTAMIDVDYYVDMPDHLSRNFRPLIMFTCQPSRAGFANGEYKYRFNADGEVRYNVSGGGEYVHKLWNWKGDSVSATRYWLGCIPITHSVFSLERRNLDPDHQLVLVTPLKKFLHWRAWLAMWSIKSSGLDRFNPVDGEFVRVLSNGSSGMQVSTSKVDGYLSSNVPVEADEAIASAAETTKRITHATVQSKMAQCASSGEDKFPGSEILLEYHLRGTPVHTRMDLVDHVRGYQWMKKLQDYEPEAPAMVSFMDPLFDGAFVPDKCKNNEQRMVDKRVTALKHKANNPSPFLITVMNEFINKFIAVSGQIIPLEEDVVYERQNKPTQRKILDDSQHEDRNDRAKVFMKAEAYGKVNDPRAITTINGVDKRKYSAYIYAVADKMKLMEWYAFGKNPMEIANRLAEICTGATSHHDDTDFKRQDGRVDALARYFERLFMMALFLPTFHIEMLKLMRTQTGLRARTTFGVKYNTDDARCSGSAETSAFNTLLTAFIVFLGFRMTSVGGDFFDADEAWEKLGMYGGDDGATADQDRRAVVKAASMMGQELTVNRTRRGLPGVSFLARCYGPDVWWGDCTSSCDIRRQIAKFHVTARLPSTVTPVMKLQEKAQAFQLSDRHTPIIGPFVNKVLELFPLNGKVLDNLKIWNYDPNQPHYPNWKQDWMTDLVKKQIPEFDLTGYDEWIESITYDNREQLLKCPLFAPSAEITGPSGLFVLDGEVFGHEEEETKEDDKESVKSTGSQRKPSSRNGSKEPDKKYRKRTSNRFEKAQGTRFPNGRKNTTERRK